MHERRELRERLIDSKVEVTHEEVDIFNSILLNHVFLLKQTDFFEHFLSHLQSSFDFVLSRLEMAVDEAELGVVESELDHDTSLEAIVQNPYFILCDELFVLLDEELHVLCLDED